MIFIDFFLSIFPIEGTTSIIDGLYEAAINQQQSIKNSEKSSATQKPSSIIYAVFTTPQNAIPGSAVCAFHVDDIIETFEGKTWKRNSSPIRTQTNFHFYNIFARRWFQRAKRRNVKLAADSERWGTCAASR